VNPNGLHNRVSRMARARWRWTGRNAVFAIAMAALAVHMARERYMKTSNATWEAAVVLGYALKGDGAMTSRLKCRVRVGLELWRRNRASTILFSGGHPGVRKGNDTTEALAMANFAMELGGWNTLPEAWRLEGGSTSTRENAVFSLDIAEHERWKRIVVVTNRFHQNRARRTFRKAAEERGIDIAIDLAQGLDVCEAEINRTWIHQLEGIFLELRERIALPYYYIKGWV